MKNLTAIIADDNEIDRYLSRRVLDRSELFSVIHEYSNGNELAPHLAEFDQPSDGRDADNRVLLLIDVNMPGIGGFGVLEALHKARQDRDRESGNITAVLVLTSSCSPNDKERVLSFEFVTACIEKPITIEKLRDALQPTAPRELTVLS